MCRVDSEDMPSVHWQAFPKAAKPHTCHECGRQIAKGEKHALDKGKWDGRWEQYRTCVHCLVGRNWLSSECGGWIYGQVVEEIHEHADEYKLFDLYRFTVGANRGWKRFYSDELMPVPPDLPIPKYV